MIGHISALAMPANTGIDDVRAAFEIARPMTVGLEEELMVLDPGTLDLAPRAREVLLRVEGDPRFKPELPAAQLEIVCPPAPTVPAAAALLATARRDLTAAVQGLARFAGAGAHPFGAATGELSEGERYERLVAEYGPVLRRQLVFGLHVHVAVSGADRALAVYNALREHLPALAALGAASPFYEGRDTGLASVRPKICELLPRQGVPPVIPSWKAFAEALAWGRAPGPFADARWWWEARLHPVFGTVEVRVADAQATVSDTACLAAVVHALVATLVDRHAAGELEPDPAETWRIAENRWAACRHGIEGRWIDARSGRVTPMRDHLHRLLDALGPAARRHGCEEQLTAARDLVESPRAGLARAAGPTAHAAHLADSFLAA
jgi:glutamate---cysteine ligase / carboxylate-amine ligase